MQLRSLLPASFAHFFSHPLNCPAGRVIFHDFKTRTRRHGEGKPHIQGGMTGEWQRHARLGISLHRGSPCCLSPGHSAASAVTCVPHTSCPGRECSQHPEGETRTKEGKGAYIRPLFCADWGGKAVSIQKAARKQHHMQMKAVNPAWSLL